MDQRKSHFRRVELEAQHVLREKHGHFAGRVVQQEIDPQRLAGGHGRLQRAHLGGHRGGICDLPERRLDELGGRGREQRDQPC
jgi:hypothetical protein